MKIAVVGTGYVGLVAGVCFADAGHHVTCVDTDAEKIASLKKGLVPIYEPGLEDIMRPATTAGRLKFTVSIKEALDVCDTIFVAVGTPDLDDGSADMRPTRAVLTQIAATASGPKFIVLKSTVPVGTAAETRTFFRENCKYPMEVISNPEFLKEGAAVDDFLKPDRIIVGCTSKAARDVMDELYAPFVKNGRPIYFMDNASAELTKYAANAFLSVKISFINELALLADKVGADVNQVRQGFTTDRRINPAFFYPGVGFGGSCFPKDVKALVHTGEQVGLKMRITQSAYEVNQLQRGVLFDQMKAHFKTLKGLKIAIWGLSFKPRTDDVREAPALYLIEKLVEAGAQVVAFDPIAAENAKRACKASFEIAKSPIDALRGADALAVVTEWNEFRSPDFMEIKSLLKTPILFDGRNIYDPIKMKELGFNYYCIGRNALSQGPKS